MTVNGSQKSLFCIFSFTGLTDAYWTALGEHGSCLFRNIRDILHTIPLQISQPHKLAKTTHDGTVGTNHRRVQRPEQ
jgi:hypothetical protein